MTITEIKKLLSDNHSTALLEKLRKDSRPAVQKLLFAHERKIAAQAKEIARLRTLYKYEDDLKEKGFCYIAGVDEAGRGPLAGPLVVAAAVLPDGCLFYGLNDSKQVKEKLREQLFEEIMEKAVAVSIEIITVETIDKINIYQATIIGMRQALLALPVHLGCALIDAMPLTKLPFPTISIVHGDSISASIAAASILAKVTRDRIMAELDKKYPGYGFSRNKGYGTREHIAAIAARGATPEHRRSFEPLKSLLMSGGDVFEYTGCGAAAK